MLKTAGVYQTNVSEEKKTLKHLIIKLFFLDTEVTVELRDVNDNRPEIISDPQVTILNDIMGITDIEFAAKDADSGDFGHCIFKMETNNDTYKEYLEITDDGNLKVLKSMIQIEESWEFNTTVSDKGQPPLSSTKTIKLDIKDVNDQKPAFISPSGTVFISDVS